MKINFSRIDRMDDYVERFRDTETLQVLLIGTAVLFASLGLGEAVYRLAFSDFDGAKDRLPIEALFGLLLSYLATKLVRQVCRSRKHRIARLKLISHKSHRIKQAVEAISPLAHPLRNQQSIRVIYEEVDHIESALREVLPR